MLQDGAASSVVSRSAMAGAAATSLLKPREIASVLCLVADGANIAATK